MSTKMRSVLLCAATLASPGAWAGATANVGVVSDYMFRGITQTAGPAVQGGIDYSSEVGIYVGTWISNIGFGGGLGGTEQDVYVGFAKALGPVTLDVGALYYWYPEESETSCGTAAECELSTLEFYLGATMGPVSVKYFLGSETNFFIGDGDAEGANYLLGSLNLPMTDSLNFTATLGMYSGDEIERVLVSEDSYMDYSVGLAKAIDKSMTATFQYIASDIDEDTTFGFDDAPKVVVGLKKTFDL